MRDAFDRILSIRFEFRSWTEYMRKIQYGYSYIVLCVNVDSKKANVLGLVLSKDHLPLTARGRSSLSSLEASNRSACQSRGGARDAKHSLQDHP